MYVKVRTIDGKSEQSLEISKLMTINDFKTQVAKNFSLRISQIRLFYRGKQLESVYRICDYNLNHHDVVQLFITSKTSENDNDSAESKECKNTTDSITVNLNNKEFHETNSSWYKIGDKVDCIDEVHGAWFEAIILKILSDGESLMYRVQWQYLADDEAFDVAESMIRPRAHTCLTVRDVTIGQRVMINYNTEEPKEDGYWYDFTVRNIKKSRWGIQLSGTLHIGRDQATIENCKINTINEIYKIEKPIPISNRDEREMFNYVRRKIAIICESCRDDGNVKCCECGCCICLEKRNPRKIILCDECDKAYHIGCLIPPLETVPDDDWYCPNCKTDSNQVVKAGEKLKATKKKIKTELKKGQKDWGRGMGCMGRVKECTLVPPNHKGAIPGIEVGMSWKYRLQVAEAGVHRPHVAGIHGRESECAYSLVLSGGYEDDVDNGDEFLYSGSGGRDLSGNKRTAAQSSDQTLTKLNKALALNCKAEFNDIIGATADNWQEGIPVRVVRSAKMRKHSQSKKYAPEQGFRYDGIYKVVKYYPEKGKSGFTVWRYLLRRHDEIPAPWTREGRRRIEAMGIQMIDYDVTKENSVQTGAKRMRQKELIFDTDEEKSKKRKLIEYQLEDDLANLIQRDHKNSKLWKECCALLADGKIAFINYVSDRFTCVCCQDIVWRPITTKCSHNICQSCLERSFKAAVYSCPMCRKPMKKTQPTQINETLAVVLEKIFPGYGGGRL